MIEQLSRSADKLFLFPTNIRGRELSEADYKALPCCKNPIIKICPDYKTAIDAVKKESVIGLITGSIYNIEKTYDYIRDGF